MWLAYKRFASGPLGLFGAAIVFTSGAILSWRWGIAPIMKRRKRDQNEEFAEYIFQERQKKLGESVHQ